MFGVNAVAQTDVILPAEPTQDLPAIRTIGLADLKDALAKGLDDFRAMPTHVIFLSVIYPIVGIALGAATFGNDGIVNIPGANGTGAFAVATVNVGVGGSITAMADTGSATLPVNIFLCQTNPATGQCISTIGNSVTTTINANATPTFAVFVQGDGTVPFDPAANRIFVRFGSNGVTRGSTSVAIRTQ